MAAILAGTLAGALAVPAEAAARDDDRGRPWARGTIRPSFGFGVGLGRDITQLGFGLGASYFVLNGLAVGLSLSDSVMILHESLKSEFPGINKQIPTNIFRIVPGLQYVFFRSRWFSPYVHAGVGPAFFNNRRGTLGYWVAGPGAYIGIGGPVFLNLGVDFMGMFPVGKCNRAFTYNGAMGDVRLEGYCAFGWSPNIGIVVAFGGGGSKRRAKPRSAPSNPLPETIEPAPAPVEPPVEAAEPVEPPVEAPAEPPIEGPTPPPVEGPTPPVEGPTPQPVEGPTPPVEGPTPQPPVASPG